MLKNVWNRFVSTILILAMFSCILLPQVQVIHAANEVNGIDDESTQSDSAIHTIEDFSLAFQSGATLNDAGQYVWTAENSNEGHGFIYKLHFSISGEGALAPETIEIRIPKQILKNSSGDFAGEIQLPYPAENEEYDKERIDYVYREENDEIVIYNVKSVNAGSLEIPFMYETTEKTWEYKDMEPSVPCVATVTVQSKDSNGNSVTIEEETKEKIPVYIDTNVKIASASKKINYPSEEWDDGWGTAVKPENFDDYVYFVWNVNSNITNVTQKYNFNISDTFGGLTSVENDTAGEVIGYKMKGSAVYVAPVDGKSPTVENLTESGLRTDSVLTAYPKSALDEIGESELKNSVTATVEPADGIDDDSSAFGNSTYTYENPEPAPLTYNPPGERYQINKYGIYGAKKHVGSSNNISSYELESLKNGTSLPGLTYHIVSTSNAYIRTLEDGATGTEQDAIDGKFGKKPITYALSDSEIYLNDSQEALSKADYTFTSLEYTIKMQDAAYNEEKKTFNTQNVTVFSSNDILEFYVMTEDNADYVLAATYNLGTGETWRDSNYISSMRESSVNFNGDIKGWKIETSNPYYSTEFNVYPKITLNSTDAVKTAIGDSSKLAVKNKSTFDIIDSNKSTTRTAVGADYVAEVQRNSNITKKFLGSKNYPGQRSYKVNWMTSINETYIDDNGTIPVKQESGVFYDLLPAGCRVDLSSIKVYADDTALIEGEYVVEKIIEDYKDSGRVLLTVRINEPAETKYTMTYTTVHLWEDILDNGRYVLNSVAYETGNEDIAGGYPDNGGKISDSTLLEDLDPDSNDKRFIYSQATHTINALIPFFSGITKKVASDYDASLGDETIVYQDSGYVYSIRMENSSLTSSKDIIILDSIENFCSGLNGAAEDKVCDWHGTLVSFGLSNIKSKGIEPVIYLSSAENINFADYTALSSDEFLQKLHDYKDKNGNPIWIKAEEFGDYSNAKAFVIDLSRKTDDSEFVLGPNESFSFTVNMRSPNTVDSEEITLETYNNVYRSFTSIDTELEDETYVYTHYDYTTVAYRTVGTLNFKKIDSDTKEHIQGIKFNLYGTSVYGTVVDKDIVTNINGEVCLSNLERGTYVLSEIDSTPDYLPGNDRTVIVDENGNVTITPTDGDSGGVPVIENTPRIHGDFSFLKRDSLNLNGVVLGAEFTLTGTSDYGNKIVKTATSNGYGVTFEDVELGTYTLTETSVPENYIAAKQYTVVCDKDGIISIVGLSLNTNGDYMITDMPRQSFSIRKVDAVNQAQLQGAEFTLKSVKTDSGEIISKTVTSDMFGIVTFDGLDFGTYKLKETIAPKNHALDATEYTVEIKLVDNQKVVTINGLKIEENTGYFIFPNERENNGTIRIIKKWVDDSDNDNRPMPIIHLSTEEPEVNSYKAMINRDLFKAAFPTTATSIQRDTWSSLADMETFNATVIGKGSEKSGADDEKAVYLYSIGTDYYIWSEAETIYLPAASNQLFQSDTALTRADLSGLNSSKVTSMISMFNGCSALETVNLTGFDISNVTSMESMFQNCTSITELDLSSFGTANQLTSTGTGARNMFNGCAKVKSIKLPNFKADNSFIMQNMFSNCTLLESVTFNTQSNSIKPTNIYGLFYKCPALQTLNLSGFDTSSTTNMAYAFSGCNNLLSLDLGDNFVLTNVTTTLFMFDGCKVLTSLDCSCFGDALYLETTQQMFQNCNKLTSIDLSNFKTSTKLTSMYEMFGFCNSLTEVRFSNGLNTSSVTKFKYMFYDCKQLTELDLSMFNISTNENANIDMQEMFRGCSSLKTIYASPDKWSTDRVTTHSGMFNGCSALVGGNGTTIAKMNSVVDKTYARIDGGPNSDTPGYLTNIADKPSTASDSILNMSLDIMKVSMAESDTLLAVSEDSTEETTTDSDTDGSSGEVTEYVSTAENWTVIDDNTWVCEFKVYDDEALYYVWEDAIAGYQSDATKNNPKTVNADGSITKLQTVTNKTQNVPEPEVGDLKLSKTVTKEGTPVTNDTTEFTFKITLSGTGISGTQYFGTTEFTDGVATITLKNNGSLTIPDIPAGTTYTIKETDIPYGYESKTISPVTGTIVKDTTAAVNWENAVIVRKTSAFHVKKAVELYQVTENLNGTESDPVVIEKLPEDETNQEFTFVATLSSLDRNGTYTIKKGEETLKTFNSNTLGEATITFTLKSGETADFADIPIGATYKITETDLEGYTASYKLTDANNQDMIVTPNGDSSTDIETLEENENVTVAFTNVKTVKINETVKLIQVAVEKQWSADTLADRPASITVYLERGVKLFSGSDTLYNQEICETVSLTADDEWKTVFADLPQTDDQGREYVYSVSEDAVAGYDCTEITKVTDESGNLTFTITNTKQPTYDLSINKIVTGVFGNKAKQFEFTVTLTDRDGKPLNGLYTLRSGDDEVQILFDVNGKARIGISHGETAVIANLPQGAKFTVTETDYSKDGYTTKSALGDEVSKGNRTVTGDLSSNQTVYYENNRSGILPTGIAANVILLVILGAASLGGIVLLKRKQSIGG